MSTAKTIDAFILFNENEKGVVPIVEQLESRGVETYFWRRDVPLGAKWEDVNQGQLTEASSVVTFLGELGWGPTHEKLAEQARSIGKRMLPVLIGAPPDGALDRVGGLFRDHRYADLREPTERLVTDLANTILQLPSEPLPNQEVSQEQRSSLARFDRVIEVLVDGNDEQRADTVAAIRALGASNRPLLATRLRSEIIERFSPESEADYAPAVRDPKRVSSIRSWMLSALIWLDAESEDSRALISKHLDPEHETDRNVRFWVLASLGQVRARYLREAMSQSSRDPAREVEYLALAFANPADESTINRFQTALQSGDFDTAWPVLRVLRIVPIPPLVGVILELLTGHDSSEPWHYDAIYALALPEMAAAAAKGISDRMKVEDLVRLVVQSLRGSNSNTVVAFAHFLSAFDEPSVDRAIAAMRSDAVLGEAATRLAQALFRVRRSPTAQRELSMAGYANDTIDPRFDRLDISRDVRTLTAVMLSTEVKPPLAIGLFGDWGSGKSFFMQSMNAAVIDLAKRTKEANKTNFCTEIVQIEFNAWHYADTNLWASIVDYILERLAAKVQPQPTPEEQQAAILAELGSTKAIVSQAETEKEAIKTLINGKTKEIEKLRVAREGKEVKLRDLEIADFEAALAGADKKEVEGALKALGVPEAVNNVKELAKVVAETNSVRGQMVATMHTLLNQKNPVVFWVLMLVALFGIPVATWALNKAMNTDVVNTAASAAAEIGALITALVAAMRKGLSAVKTHLATVEKARKRIEEQLEKKRLQPEPEETKLREELAGLVSQEEEAANRLSAASARVVELEERINVLKEGRSLARFLTERRQSQDYQKHLGLISTIRKDFNSLQDRLNAANQDPKHRVDRIILYIDDLDRCPPEKVLEVLQAVHLLLAFRLFVVVVGVDPRWLRHSLARNYSALQSDLDDDWNQHDHDTDGEKDDGLRAVANRRADSRATPQNYLEKIFQVPFALHRMSETGYGDLVEALFTPASTEHGDAHAGKTSGSGTILSATGTSTVGGSQASGSTTTRPSSGGSTSTQPQGSSTQNPQSTQTSQQPSTQASTTGSTFVISDEALVIQKWEARFARRLYPLIPTPRAAKRLTNVYRILKACVLRHELREFEGSDAIGGEFQLPMLLLAMIIKAPTECAQVFPLLLRRIREGKNVLESLRLLEQLASEVDGDETKFRLLADAIRPIVHDPSFTADNDAFAKWIPQVSRYSFEIGGVLRPANEKPSSSSVRRPTKRQGRSRTRSSTANGRSKKG